VLQLFFFRTINQQQQQKLKERDKEEIKKRISRSPRLIIICTIVTIVPLNSFSIFAQAS
jgi:hypothetical protein